MGQYNEEKHKGVQACGHDHHSHQACGCGGHHHEHEVCGCGKEHPGHEECGCGESHEHEACACGDEHHEHEECDCGEEHHHSHEMCGCGGHHHEHEECGCGEEHEHMHEPHEEHRVQAAGKGRLKVYILENLGCANCAAKMEKKIRELPGVQDASITFSTKQLRVAADNPDAFLPVMQQICASIESEVVIKKREQTEATAKTAVTKEKGLSSNMRDGLWILGGAVLFIAGFLLRDYNGFAANCCFIAAYIVLGLEIVLTAVKNIFKGNVFDENFLMSIATLGAFAIGEFAEAVGVMLFYRVGELFEKVAVERSRSQIMDAVDMRPEVVSLVRGEDVQVIPAGDAKEGDVVLVRPGDRIPLDGTIVQGESRLDTSAVTGEPVPVAVKPGDAVLSGCVNASGLLKLRVDKVLEESMVSRILDSVENAAASKPKMDRFITKFARVYTPFVVILALATAVIPSLITGEWSKWIYTALTFLVISCPCALVLSVPLAFFSGIGAGSKIGILFKGGLALEAIRKVKAIVMDKTGTITEGNFAVQAVTPADNRDSDVLLALAAACELGSTHPIGESIVAAAKGKNLGIARPESVEEISGKGIHAVIDGKDVLCGNRQLMQMYRVDIGKYQQEAYGSEVLVAEDGVYIGHLVIADTVKSEAASAISALKKQGLCTVMLTGDAQGSADAVAAETGIDEVHAKLLPVDKLNKLKIIRKQHGPVMFVGDGINDAPVLAGADVGAAMGSGADAAIEAADLVFMNSSVEAIPRSIGIARKTNQIAIQNVVFALAVKVLVMILGLAGFANMWMAVFADTGVAMLCVLNSIRVLYTHSKIS